MVTFPSALVKNIFYGVASDSGQIAMGCKKVNDQSNEF